MNDNSDLEELMFILENMKDEQLAVKLLKELNDRTKALGSILLDVSPELQNAEWKGRCDSARGDVDKIISTIKEEA